MKLLFVFILFFISVSVSAQVNIDSLRLQYSHKTMFAGFNKVMMNGIMLGKNETGNLMLVSPEASKQYKLYRKNNNTGIILNAVGVAAVVSGLFLSNSDRKTGSTIIISGSVVNAVGALFYKIANQHLHQAIWKYNRDVLFPVKK